MVFHQFMKFHGNKKFVISNFENYLIKIAQIFYIQTKKNFSPKCYAFQDGNVLKRSHKGTPKNADLQVQNYLDALFENKIKKVQFNRIAIDNNLGSAVTRTVIKKALNPTYLKLKVLDDLVTVVPYHNENVYL